MWGQKDDNLSTKINLFFNLIIMALENGSEGIESSLAKVRTQKVETVNQMLQMMEETGAPTGHMMAVNLMKDLNVDPRVWLESVGFDQTRRRGAIGEILKTVDDMEKRQV